MANRCGWCSHPDRLELEQRVAAGAPLRVVAKASGYSESAAQRHIANHVRPDLMRAMQFSAEMHVADFAVRLSSLTDETARVRQYASEVNDPKLLLSAVQQERETLVVLMNRLGLDDDAAVDTLAEIRDLARVLARVLPSQRPEVSAAIAGELRSCGRDELAENFDTFAAQAAATHHREELEQ